MKLLITELVLDSEQEENVPLYNFIEVYNNTDRSIALKDFDIRLRYTGRPEFDKVWHPEADDVVVEPGRPIVFWIKNPFNEQKTVADFNAKYGCDLAENKDIVRLEGEMMNSKQRTVVISTKARVEAALADYNANSFDVAYEKSLLYKAPEDGGRQMVLYSCMMEAPSPGQVSADQIPQQPVQVDETAKLVRDLTRREAIRKGSSLEFVAEIADDAIITHFSFYYKSDRQKEFTLVELLADWVDGLFRYTVEAPFLLGSNSVSYYFAANDGHREMACEPVIVEMAEEAPGPRLSVSEGELLAGEVVIHAAGDTVSPGTGSLRLFIDGSEPEGVFCCLDQPVFFVFEVLGIHRTYKNGVVLGNEVIKLMNYSIVEFDYDTVTAPVDPVKLRQNDYTISVRAGSRDKVLEDREIIGLDYFSVRNVRLVLADGTVIRDRQFVDAGEVIVIDGREGGPVQADFTFDVPAAHLTAKAVVWDTTSAADGEYRIAAAAPGQGETSVKVIVDNSGPVIRTNVEEGQAFRGEVRIEATATDEGAGVAEFKALLDGEEIELPTTVSANLLGPGTHQLQLIAIDKAGNRSMLLCEFDVVLPERPVLLSPAEGEAVAGDDGTVLRAKVGGGLQDMVKVTFCQGYRYTSLSTENVRVYKHATPVEPPAEACPRGEAELSREELECIAAADDRYVTVDSEREYPYVRFELCLDEACGENAEVELVWTGRTLPGRRVTMYAWSCAAAEWQPLDARLAETEADFTLRAKVGVFAYAADRRVNVLVQDLVEAEEKVDFTFVLMPDTQMYSMLHPHYYDAQVNWIKENVEALNICYVAHVGDIVDMSEVEYQWQNADRSMRILDEAGIPYGVVTGNHDTGCGHRSSDLNYVPYSRYFGERRFKDKKYYGGSYDDNRGHYDLISAGGMDFIFIYMGHSYNMFMADDQVDWMNEVLAVHRERKAIVIVHDYLRNNGERSEKGEYVYEKVVVPNANVIMTMNGHYHGSAQRVDELDDDGDGIMERKVYQLSGTKGVSTGFLTLLHFDLTNQKLYVRPYSPVLNEYNSELEFTLDFGLAPPAKRVATRSFEAMVYSEQKIGEAAQVAGGETAEVKWEVSRPGRSYGWYAKAEDRFGGTSVSEIRSFRKK